MRGAIILAGGPSRRLGRPKPFVSVGGATLLERVVRAASSVVGDLVVVSRGPLAAQIREAFPDLNVVEERVRAQTPLVGLYAGSRALGSAAVAALPCDLPFLKPRLLGLLFSRCRGTDAAIPRWPDGKVEPLVAVYRRTALLEAARASLAAGERSNQEMIARIPRVRYVATSSLRKIDPALRSFVNVNTPSDLARARRLTRSAVRPRTR